MPQFVVEERCLIGGSIRRPGDVIEYEGNSHPCLKPLNPPKPVAEAPTAVAPPVAEQPVKRKRGRPRKNPLPPIN
jgi:hypothetical protein